MTARTGEPESPPRSTRTPDVIADSGVRYRTNVDVMRMDRLPRTMTILGGGIIAVEFAAV
ncbi:mycothione reductase, partial [Corynebacterium bovis]